MTTTSLFGEDKGENARAFPVLYYDDHNLFPTLLPFIEARLPLDGVPVKNPFSPHAAVYCNTLRLNFIRRDCLSDTAVPPKTAVSGSSSFTAAAAAAAKLTGASLATASSGSCVGASASHAPTPGAAITAGPTAASLAVSAGGAQPGSESIPLGRQGRAAAAATAAATTGATKPFVYLQILQLENIEDYKTHHRRVLRAWVDSLTEQHEEWLVLYVTPFSESETQSRSCRKILDKLRSDLNPPGSRSKERFLRVPTDPTGQYSHAPVFHDLWNALMLRLKEALAAAVEGRYVQLEDEVQRQTQAAEPRFCAVFTAKEDLALLHALCNRPDEALAVLDSLDLLRNSSGGRGLYDFHVTSSDIPPWQNFFHTFGFASTDAEVPVLLNQRRLERLQVALREDTISYIDFRQYLFARQAELLLRLNRLEELGARAVQLVSSVYKELLSRNISIGGHTWALLAALNFAGYIVAQSAVTTERCAAAREASEATPRSMAAEESSPWRSSRPQDFTASPSSSTPAGSPYGSVSTHPLLPLKYPTLASAARTLHRFTPLQFSFSPTRRAHASHRGRVPPVSSLQADATAAPSPVAADPAAESVETGGVEDSAGTKEGSRGNAGGVVSPTAAAGAAPAPAARYAGVLYGYAAQQLQRLIRWRKRRHWYTPLKEIPLTDTDGAGQQDEYSAGESAASTAAVESRRVEAAAADKAASDEKASAVRSGGLAGGQEDGSDEDLTEGGEVDNEPFFCPADMERLEGLLLIVSRKSLLEELQTAAAMEDMLARVFVLAGQQYMNGGYYRHAALLQFRLAAANFRRGCLEECRSSLGRLLPLFLKEPWTELWLECQQLLCEADHRAGDAEAELRSAYVLSNVKAQYYSKRLMLRATPMQKEWKTEGGAAGVSAAAGALSLQSASGTADNAAPQVMSVGTAGARPAVEGGYEAGDTGDATGTERFSVNPREFLQRFIMLARSQQAEHLPKPPREAGGATTSRRRDRERLPPAATGAETNAAAAQDTSATARLKDAAADSHPSSATHGAEKRSEKLTCPTNGAAADEEEERPRRTPTCTIISDLDFCETLCTEERSLHISSSPNLYCWAALTTWRPDEDRLGEGMSRECLQPALALASAPTLTPVAEPLVATGSLTTGLPHFYGGGSVDGTPYTLTSATPTGATTTTSFFSNTVGASSSDPSAATAGRTAALLCSRRHMLSSLPPGALTGGPSSSWQPSILHAGLPAADVASILRGSQSRAEGEQELAHVGGGLLKGSSFSVVPRSPATSYYSPSFFGSPAREMGGTGVPLRNLLRAKGSIDHDLLEHAVLRQLADLLPLYQLPCHPELGPNAYLFTYVATLLRLKPKSVAQVLGQHPRLRMRRPGAPPSDRVRTQEQQQVVATGDQTEHSELQTVAATEHEGETGEEQLLSRPRSAVRAASEGTQKRPRGSTNSSSTAETGDTSAEPGTPAGEQGALNRSSSGLSGGLRDFRWRRSKTLTHVHEAALPKEAEGAATGDAKGDQCPEPFLQLTPHETHQRSGSRNTKGTGRVSLLLSRRRRSATSAAAASVTAAAATSAAVETAGRSGKKAARSGEQTEQALPSAAEAASASRSAGENQNGDADTAKSGPVASGGGATARLPEQFRSYAQQLPAAALDASVHSKITGFDCGQSPAPPLLQTRPRDALLSHARSAGGGESAAAPDQQFYGRRQLAASGSPAGVNATVAPRSRALSVLEMSSMQNVLPSLSVSLGQHIELQVYVHSCLAGPLPADYIAIRLSQLPTSCLDVHLGAPAVAGSMRTEPHLNPTASQHDFVAATGPESPRASHFTDQGKYAGTLAASSVSGEEKEEVFDQQRAGAAASMWLVARSGQSCAYHAPECGEERAGQTGKQSQLLDEGMSDKLVLRPGVNRLSLLWSSRIEGIFVLEQICVGVGAAALVQWAGDLPLPDMMDAVAKTMQKVLVTASLLQQRWHRQMRGGGSPLLASETAQAGTETGTGTTVKTPGSSTTRRASMSATTTHGVVESVADAAQASGGLPEMATAGSDLRGGRGERSDGVNQRVGDVPAFASHTQASCPSTLAETAAAVVGAAALEEHQADARDHAIQQETHCSLLTKQSENPLFQPVDCGSLASASAFEERADPPAWLLQQLARGCSPLAATLLQPVAPLERMLRPLIFEVRSPSTAVQIRVQAASPSDNFLFLDATNFFVVRIDVMPGLFAGPTPCRLRVLQCLLPVIVDEQQEGATGHLLPKDLHMQDSFFLGERSAENSAVGDRDIRSYYRNMPAGGRRGSQHSRVQRQTTSTSRGRSGQQDRDASLPVGAASASPALLPRSPGTAGAATWRRYFREGGGSSYRTPQGRWYGPGSMTATTEADRLGRYNSPVNCGNSSHGMAASAAYGKAYGRNHSQAYTDKDAFASPWTPAMDGFDLTGLTQPDDQQLFEAAAVRLQFQWHQAVVQSIDGVAVYRKLGVREPFHSRQRKPPAPGAATAAGGRDEHAEKGRGQRKHHRLYSPSKKPRDSGRLRNGGRPPGTWHLGEGEIKEEMGSGVTVSGSDSSHPDTVVGGPSYPVYESVAGTYAQGEPQGSQRHGFLRICAEDEEGDVLALVPQQSESGPRWGEQRSGFRRADNTRSTAEPPGCLRGGACWLELPPFQSSCEVLVPVIPLWADAWGSGDAEPYAAAAGAGPWASATPHEDTLTAPDFRVLPHLASTSSLRPQGSLDSLRDGDAENLRGNSRLTALRPRSGGRTRVSMPTQESPSPVDVDRRPSWVGRQQLGSLRVKEEMGIHALKQRRLSSWSNGFANALQLRSCDSRALTLLRVGWGEGPERLASQHYMEELLLPHGFSFRRRRSAFVVPPPACLPAGPEDTYLLDGERAAPEADAYVGAAGRTTATVVGAQDLPLQSPAARAARQISVAAVLNSRQQQMHEQQHRDQQQEQLRPPQEPESLQQRFSSAYGCLPPPLEYHVHIVTTLHFYTRTGIPAPAAARACQGGSGGSAWGSAAARPTMKPQQKLSRGCWCRSCVRPSEGSEVLCESEDVAGETLAAQINDLGVLVPSVYPRKTAASRRNTVSHVLNNENLTSETEKSDTAYADPLKSAHTGVPTLNTSSEGTDGSASPEGGNESAAAGDVLEYPCGASAAAAEASCSPASRAPSWRRNLSPMRTAASGAASETLRREELVKSGGLWRRLATEADEEGGPVEEIEEEAFDSVQVCAQETIWLRQQQRKELAALLAQGGGKGDTRQQEAIADDTTIPSSGAEQGCVEGRALWNAARKKGRVRTGREHQDGHQLRQEGEAPATRAEKAIWRSSCTQPAIVMLASTSRVHRLAVRVALQHSERLLHVSKDAMLQQVFLSSCCSPAEPVVVESAFIVPLPSGRSDDDVPRTEEEESQDEEELEKRTEGDGCNRTGEPTAVVSAKETARSLRDARVEQSQRQHNKQEREQHTEAFRERHRSRKRRLQRPRTKVSLIAPPPAGLVQQGNFFTAPPQEAESVRLDSLLFGEKMTALLVHVEHRRRQGRKLSISDTAARRNRGGASQRAESVRDLAAGRTNDCSASGSDKTAAEEALLSRRIRAAFEPKLDAYLLSVHYRFLQRPEGKKRLRLRGAADVTAAAAAASLGAGDQELCVNTNDEATTQDTETTEPEDEQKSREELLVYRIPLVFPVQQFPFEVRFHAPRLGRVSAPLVVCLVFTNCSDVQLDVRHAVSLEFDVESGPATRAAAKFFSLSPLLSSRSLGSRLQLQYSRFYSTAGSLGLLDNSSDGARLFSGWRGPAAGGVPAAAEEPGKGSTGKKDAARSSRLGECHDWLMVGSKCKTTTLAARSTARVHFQLVPLRAGSLPLPTVRVRIRPSSEGQRRLLANSFLWQYATGGEPAAGVTGDSDGGAGAAVSAAAAAAEKGGKNDRSPLLSPDAFSLSGQNLWHGENGAAHAPAASTDWWLPVPYGESVTAGREVLVLPKLVSKPDARLLPD